jgi:hypothetical protein
LLWWLSIIGGVTVVMLIWFVTTPPIDMMISIVEGGSNMEGRPNEVISRVSGYWNLAPLMLIVFLVAFGFIRVLKKEGVQYQ